jgi:hypothetical protein
MSSAPVTRDPSLAGEFNYRLANGLSRKLIRKLARTDIRARKLAHSLALQRLGATSSDVDLAFDLAEVVANLHIRAVRLPSAIGTPCSVETRTAYLAQGLEFTTESAYKLVLQLDRVSPHISAQARRIAQACNESATLLHKFTTALNSPEEDSFFLSGKRRVSLPAQWLIGSAVRMLPASDQPRYSEEWRSELWDLATEPRRRHLAHALRVTVRAWPTRRAILNAQHDDGGWEW